MSSGLVFAGPSVHDDFARVGADALPWLQNALHDKEVIRRIKDRDVRPGIDTDGMKFSAILRPVAGELLSEIVQKSGIFVSIETWR